METEHSNNNDKGADLSDHGANNNVQDRKKVHQKPANDIIKDTQQNRNRSGSEQQNSISNLNSPFADHYEDNINPSLENRASEDDEFEEEIASDHHNRDYIEKNDLEKTDQDFRDGDNQFAEDQDENDELRNGK
jgi:hypothetical protein